MSANFITHMPDRPPRAHLLLAHGAGAGMDSAFLETFAAALVQHRVGVSRFEFDYMHRRRVDGTKRPPTRVDKLVLEYEAAIDQVRANGDTATQLFIGGKSMGGRVASMFADAAFAESRIHGVICLGYPFHPAGKPDNPRTAHLENLKCPTLIVQGERDKLGSKDDVTSYSLSKMIEVSWLEDGDHDLKPRKKSGFSHEHHIETAARLSAEFIQRIGDDAN